MDENARMTAFLLTIIAALVAVTIIANAALARAEARGFAAGRAAERDDVIEWLDGTGKGLVAKGAINDARTMHAVEALLRAGEHRRFLDRLDAIDAEANAIKP